MHYREKLEIFPSYEKSDYVLVEDATHFFPLDKDPTQIIKNEWKNGSKLKVIKELLIGEREYSPTNKRTYINTLNRLSQDPNFEQIDQGEQLFLFKRRDVNSD